MAGGLSPREFLLVQDRLPRKPLAEWAGEIVPTIPAVGPGRQGDPTALSTALNLAALIEAFRGRPAHAHHLCDLHLRWLHGLAAVHDDHASVLVLAFQPWVNKGRLHALAANPAAAMPHFSMVVDHDMARPIVLGPCTIDDDAWNAIMEKDGSVRRVLENVYVVDSLKAFFRRGSYEPALGFVSRVRAGSLHADPGVLREAEVIGLAGLGRFEEAVVVARGYDGSSLLAHLVFMLHRSAGMVALGERHESRDVALELAEFSRLGGLDRFPPATVVRYLALLGGVLEAVESTVPARGVHERGLEVARRAPDQPSQVAFLDALLRSGAHDEGGRWADERSQVLENCHYQHVRRAAAMGPPPADPVFDELVGALLGATGDLAPVGIVSGPS